MISPAITLIILHILWLIAYFIGLVTNQDKLLTAACLVIANVYLAAYFAARAAEHRSSKRASTLA